MCARSLLVPPTSVWPTPKHMPSLELPWQRTGRLRGARRYQHRRRAPQANSPRSPASRSLECTQVSACKSQQQSNPMHGHRAQKMRRDSDKIGARPRASAGKTLVRGAEPKPTPVSHKPFSARTSGNPISMSWAMISLFTLSVTRSFGPLSAGAARTHSQSGHCKRLCVLIAGRSKANSTRGRRGGSGIRH